MNASTYHDTPRLQGERQNRSYKRALKAQAHKLSRREAKQTIQQHLAKGVGA